MGPDFQATRNNFLTGRESRFKQKPSAGYSVTQDAGFVLPKDDYGHLLAPVVYRRRQSTAPGCASVSDQSR